MSGLFSDLYYFNGDISQWDVLNIIDFGFMFSDCSIKEKYKPKFKLKPVILSYIL